MKKLVLLYILIFANCSVSFGYTNKNILEAFDAINISFQETNKMSLDKEKLVLLNKLSDEERFKVATMLRDEKAISQPLFDKTLSYPSAIQNQIEGKKLSPKDRELKRLSLWLISGIYIK